MVSPYSRPRDGRYATGTAVPRRGYPHPYPPGGGDWDGWYGPGYWGPSWYWNSYYWRPYGYGAWGLGWGWYDPFWGYGYYGPVYAVGYGYSGDDSGAVRTRITPRDAQVFVDGGYVGIVDEFDGTFQKLRLDVGHHRIEIKHEGLETLTFEVHVTYGHTITLRGELRPLAP